MHIPAISCSPLYSFMSHSLNFSVHSALVDSRTVNGFEMNQYLYSYFFHSNTSLECIKNACSNYFERPCNNPVVFGTKCSLPFRYPIFQYYLAETVIFRKPAGTIISAKYLISILNNFGFIVFSFC